MIKLKDILFEVVTEARKRRSGSGTLNKDLEIDGLHVPGICLPTDTLHISVTIDYNYTGGTPARGMFGPPENSSPAEGAEVELLGHVVDQILLKSATGEREVYYQYLIPQQQEIIDTAIDEMIHRNEPEIEEEIMNKEED